MKDKNTPTVKVSVEGGARPGGVKPNYRFWFNIAALLVGAALLVAGGILKDPTIQAAGGAIMATVVGMIGWKASQNQIKPPPTQ